jgi:hypothetical protein
MRYLLIILLSVITIATKAQGTVDLRTATQNDLITMQERILVKNQGKGKKMDVAEAELLLRIAKSSNSPTVSFSKAPKELFESDLKEAFQKSNSFFMMLPEFDKFKRSLRRAYRQDTSVVTRVIFAPNTSRPPNFPNKQYFINLATTND